MEENTAHRYFTRFVLLLAAVAVFGAAGCSTLRTQPEPDRASEPTGSHPPGPTAERYQEPANSYYYFMMAEIQIRQGNMEQAVDYLEKAIREDPEAVGIKRELALVYIQQDKTEKALELADEILEQQPENIEALIITASIRQAMGDMQEAKQAYENVLAAAPDRKNIYLVLGRLYMQDKEFEKARNVFSRQVEQFPGDYSGHFYLGQVYEATGRQEKAIGEFEKTLALQPELLEPRVELIKIYTALDQPDKAMEQYEAIIDQQPENYAAMIELGLLYVKNQQVEDARVILHELGEQAKTDRMVINTVIQNLIAQKRYQEGAVVLEGMLEAAPANNDLHYLAGVTQYLMEDLDGALTHLQAVGPESQFYVDAAIQKAGIYNQQKKPGKAISVLESALEKIEEDRPVEKIKLIKFLSAFYEENKDFEKALNLLKDGLAMEPDNAELNYQLGVIYDQMDEKEKAIAQMRAVLDIDPENADALNYLGYTYADAGIHLEEAERLIRKALEKKPGNGYILDSMGWVYFKKGNYPQAIDYLEDAVEKVPDDPIILEHLGDAYAGAGQPAKALEVYERALSKKEAEKADLKEKIKRLKQP